MTFNPVLRPFKPKPTLRNGQLVLLLSYIVFLITILIFSYIVIIKDLHLNNELGYVGYFLLFYSALILSNIGMGLINKLNKELISLFSIFNIAISISILIVSFNHVSINTDNLIIPELGYTIDSTSTKNITSKNDTTTLKTDSIEDLIYRKISALHEVKKISADIEKASKGKLHIAIIIQGTPKELKEKYYWVQVGEDNEDRFVAYYNFYVYPDKMEIKYLDTVNDKIISLTKWRYKQKKERN